MAEEATPGTDLAALLTPKSLTVIGKIAERIASPVWERYVRKHGVDWTIEQFGRELEGVQRAAEMIEESGLPFEPISAKHMFPTLAGLQVEDDPDLRERWSALIANAATYGETSTAAYADILKQLEPMEARVLNELYATVTTVAPDLRHTVGVRREDIQVRHNLTVEDYQALADALMRHRLVAAPRTWKGVENEYSTLTITSFGARFVRACRPPGSGDPAPTILNAEQLEATVTRQADAPPEALPDEGSYFPEAVKSSPPEVDGLRQRMDRRDAEQDRLERDIALDARGA